MSSRRDRDVLINHRDPVPSTSEFDRGQSFEPVQPTLEERIRELANQPRREVSNPRAGSKNAGAKPPSTREKKTDVRSAPDRESGSRRPIRPREAEQATSIRLRPQELALLADVGRFRVVSVSDLQEHLYPEQLRELQNDLAYLREQGLVETHILNLRRDGKTSSVQRFQAVVLTKEGQRVTHRIANFPNGQRLYYGMVKRREAEHDSQIYRAYRKEVEGIVRSGGSNIRVRLDFELKSEFNRRVYQQRKQDPEKALAEAKRLVASDLELPMKDGRVVVPDARIEYDRPDGMTGRVEIEVVTAAYRHGHIAAKAQAGFKLYMSHGDIGRLGGAVQDDHDLMSEVLDL